MGKEYDIVLFGVTGFTGKLAAEWLLTQDYPIKWAVCARNAAKADAVLKSLGEQTGKTALPPVEVSCLVAEEDAEKLRAIVKKAKVVITTAGPFEKYALRLVKYCAEEGTHYADITGESDFFRAMISEHDATAQKTGAKICIHCGQDCIPWDLAVYEMSKLAKSKGAELSEATTYAEYGASAEFSGGTVTTAIYQLGKKRGGGAKPDFDPLLRTKDGSKATSLTKVALPKKDVYVGEHKQYGGPWIMGPVMANCVRRSNALLGYTANLTYGDYLLRGTPTWGQWAGTKLMTGTFAAAIYMPSVFSRFLPAPGEGPTREAMDEGWMTLHAKGTMVKDGVATPLKATYKFPKDTGYLMTAQMLVEAGMTLLEKKAPGGVLTPAAAFGSDIVARLEEKLGAKLEVES